MRQLAITLPLLSLLAAPALFAAEPGAPLIPGALPYHALPGAAATPDRTRVYKVIFDVTRASPSPDKPVDGVLFAATDLSALRGQGVPEPNTRFALIFHGPAVGALLDDAGYRRKYGVPNPNLPMLAALRREGVDILVCGQFLGAMNIDPATLTPDVTVASEAFITLIAYQNDGYAVLEF